MADPDERTAVTRRSDIVPLPQIRHRAFKALTVTEPNDTHSPDSMAFPNVSLFLVAAVNQRFRAESP